MACPLPALRSPVLALVLAVGFASSAFAGSGVPLGFGAEEFTLANGLEVVVIPNHRVPAVTQMVWYKVGAADEPRGQSGIAHFLEHLMFKGTKTVAPGEFSRIVAANGGRDNAFTTEDDTVFHQTVARDRLEEVMKLEADRMHNLALGDAVVLPERQVILEERRMRIDNSPSALLDEQTRTALYLHHPYRNPTIGWEEEMAHLTTADAVAFYRTWYHPNNAVLVVAGDITAAELRPLAEKYYGPIPAVPVPARHRLEEPPRVASTRLVSKSSQVAEANWARSWLAPSYTGGETKYAYALQVLAEILGGGATARLDRDLVVDGKLALEAGVYYDPGRLDLAVFGIYARPRHGVGIDKLEAAIDGEIKDLLAKGVTEAELDRAKERMQAAAIYERDSLTRPAYLFGAALATGRSIADVEAWPERIGRVTAAEVDAAAKYVLRDKDAVTSVLLPEHTS